MPFESSALVSTLQLRGAYGFVERQRRTRISDREQLVTAIDIAKTTDNTVRSNDVLIPFLSSEPALNVKDE